MDSRICQTFPASPAEPGGLLGALATELPAGDQVCLYFFERDAFFMPPRPGNQYVFDILPKRLVLLEVDDRRRLAAFHIRNELNSSHARRLLEAM